MHTSCSIQFVFYRLLFWGERLPPSIRRMGMDGCNVTDIVTTGISWPRGLSLDFYSERIWWCDQGVDRIE